MKESLKSSDFEKISLARIFQLLGSISSVGGSKYSYLRESYLRNTSNFDEVYFLLAEIAAIKQEGDDVINLLSSAELSSSGLKEKLLALLLKTPNKEVNVYLRNFVFQDGQYAFQPQSRTNLKTSGLRNLLIELGFLDHNASTREYFTTALGTSLMKTRSRATSALHLEKILRNRDKIGLAAELEIIKYERRLLKKSPHLLRLIKHVSRDDVGAGYDIESAALLSGESFEKKFIEVKAVSAEGDFFWSSNEIEVARLSGNNYYLYLLPVLRNGKFDLDNMRIIRDPYSTVIRNRDGWEHECAILHFFPKDRS